MLYWNIPRPWNKGVENPRNPFILFCKFRKKDPWGFSTWSNISFSPNAKTGTRDALKMEIT